MVVALAGLCVFATMQEPLQLSSTHLQPHIYRFSTDGHGLVGPGAAVLLSSVRDSSALIIGEYHGSQRLSELTRALIPELHLAGYRHIALEVGPTAGRILTRLAGDGRKTLRNLADFNQKYEVQRRGRAPSGPIPFFNDVADAQFLAEAASRKWKMFGVDQEFGLGYLPIFDELVARLPRHVREADFRIGDARKEIIAASDLYAREGTRPSTALRSAKNLQAVLDLAESTNVKGVARDIRESIAIYELNAVNDWWQSNSRRIAHMKQNLLKETRALKFDFGKDRLFLKIGSVHAGRGFSLLRHYEIGNTLSELAESAGGRSLHITVLDRYTKDGENIVDGLASDKRYEVLRQFGHRTDWTLIDLRPLKKQVYYDAFKIERYTLELIMQFDIALITPTDEAPIPNRPPASSIDRR